MSEVTIKVFRCDPESGNSPSFVTGRVPYFPGMTVLRAIHKLNEVESVACRNSCQIGSCGVCTVRINGRHALSCLRVISDPEEEIVVEPRKGRRVLRDLITAIRER